MLTFVLFSFIFIIHELSVLINPIKYHNHVLNISNQLKNKGLLTHNALLFVIFNLAYFVWSIIGLFTKFWPIFVSIIIISLISSKLNKENIEIKEMSKMRRVDSLFSIIFLLFLLYFYFR